MKQQLAAVEQGVSLVSPPLISGGPVEAGDAAQLGPQASVELASGVPFISDADLQAALDDAGVPAETSQEIVEVNQDARLDGLRAALVLLAGIALIALFAARRIPTEQPGSTGAQATA